MSICTSAPPAFRKRTWSARNDSSVCCASMSRSPAAMARRVFLSRSTKWRRDDEPLEPQARCPSWIPSRTPRGGSRADSGPQVLPPARATVPPSLRESSSRVSSLLACYALGPLAPRGQYSCHHEACSARSAWPRPGRACLSAWIEHCACFSLIAPSRCRDQLPKRSVMQSPGITLSFHREMANSSRELVGSDISAAGGLESYPRFIEGGFQDY